MTVSESPYLRIIHPGVCMILSVDAFEDSGYLFPLQYPSSLLELSSTTSFILSLYGYIRQQDCVSWLTLLHQITIDKSKGTKRWALYLPIGWPSTNRSSVGVATSPHLYNKHLLLTLGYPVSPTIFPETGLHASFSHNSS